MMIDSSVVQVRDQVVARIKSRLDAVNGRRRERIISMGEVIRMIHDVNRGSFCAYMHGGSVARAYRKRGFCGAVTTFVMVAMVDGTIFLGITSMNAEEPTVGRAFSCLQPWSNTNGPTGDASAKWAAWSASPDVIRIDAPEVDAMIDTDTI
jgi:hypothetical protein